MLTQKEWDTVYHNIMPLASVAVGLTSVALAVLFQIRQAAAGVGTSGREPLRGASPLSVYPPKVQYENGQLLVEVRNPGEWHDIREFIQPTDPRVQQLYHQVGPDMVALVDWVCRNVSYRLDDGEWWCFPGETIRQKSGDCDDSAILTCSLLRNFTDCYVAVGTWRGYGHAWGVTDSQILETTYSYAHQVPNPQDYRTYALFNEREVIERWPGAMSQLFQLARNDRQKLSLMAGAVIGVA